MKRRGNETTRKLVQNLIQLKLPPLKNQLVAIATTHATAIVDSAA
ncbi:hypothetical protein predicted by Glimmer/Critica [Limosilactobacillus fermentum]|nr:hypothetical protein predicted by Glimmer/Critica [Limosilactobacillus fermentum]